MHFFSNYKILKSFKYTQCIFLEIPQVNLAWHSNSKFCKTEKHVTNSLQFAVYVAIH